MNKFKERPDILIEVRKFGFVFLVDTSVKHNLIEPCFVDFFYEEHPPSEQRIASQQWAKSAFPMCETPLYLFEGVIEHTKAKKVRCKDGVSRTLDTLNFKFDFKGKTYFEPFCVDKCLCTYFTKKNKVSAILGTEFLKKHKWIIDYNKMTISMPEEYV